MKKFYLLAAAALCAATATAANGDVTDGWLMLEDFEGATPALSTFKPDGSGVGTGTSEVVEYGNDNHVGKFTANDARTDGFLLTVTLPANKTIADYTDISFDICGINTQYKPLRLFINGTEVTINENNVVGDRGVWYPRSYAIPEGVTGNEITIGFYNHLDNRGDAVAFDNIQLKEKDGGSGDNPGQTPGDYDESKNGTVVDGYYMAEDFQNNALNDVIGTGSYYGGNGAGGSAKVEVDSKATTNLIAHGTFSNSDWNTMFALDVTLQDDKTLKDCTAIAFDLYRFNADGGNLQIYVKAGNMEIKSPGEKEEIKTGEWLHYEYSIPENSSEEKSFKLYLGLKAYNADYAIDNIRFKMAGSSEDPDPDPTPGDYDETKNGTVNDGWLMIEDYQTKQPGDKPTVGNYYGGNGSGISAEIKVDPKKETNLIASATLTGSDWNSVFALDVVLPEGTTLKDYSAIAFDIYRTDQEGDRQIVVNAKYENINEFIKPEGNNEEIKTGEWITKEYAISENTQVGNSFKLYFGIKSGNANYAVDNIRLKAKEAPKPELEVVGEPEITVKHGSLAGIIIVSYNFELTNYNGEEIKVVASVEGHPEVSFEKVAKPANVQALAANETFSGDLKAQHDVLTTINNPNVTLTATAGEKQLFTKTKTPDTTTGIEDVTVDSEAPVEYFNLQGLRVAQPEAGRLYIKRQGDKAVKVRF